MHKNFTTITVQQETAKVYDYLKADGQSYNGFLKETAKEKTGKTWETLLDEAEENEE